MTILDRYLLFSFLRIFVVCFLSFAGLYVVIHLFSNLDELSALSEESSWPELMWALYWPRMAELFDKTAHIMALVAGIFSVHLLQRNSELTAIEAGGITKFRALRSVLLAGVVVIALTVANRELFLHTFKDRLVRTPQNWHDRGKVKMSIYEDSATGLKVRGNEFHIGEKKITSAEVQIPASISHDLFSIRSQWGMLVPATDYRPAGLFLYDVTKPDAIKGVASIVVDGQPLICTPRDFPWLKEQQCFVAVVMDPDEIAYGKKLAQYRTTPEMIAALKKPRSWFGNGTSDEVAVHVRILQPILDLTLLLIGLPMIVGGSERNIFVSAGLGFLVVGGVFLVNLGCQVLGAAHLIEPAALAAWLPLIIFVPVAALSMRKLKS